MHPDSVAVNISRGVGELHRRERTCTSNVTQRKVKVFIRYDKDVITTLIHPTPKWLTEYRLY